MIRKQRLTEKKVKFKNISVINVTLATVTKKSLNDHIKRKDSGNEEEFKCAECGKIFNPKKTLNRHMKTHD